MNSHVAWLSGCWGAREDATLALDDRGFLQGAVLVERLRTCRGKPLDVAAHIERMMFGCQSLDIRLAPDCDLHEIITQCATRNWAAHGEEDFSIVVLVTPGSPGAMQPSLLVHTTAIAWPALASWYEQGQQLIVAENRNVPQACWSPQLKTRSRLHYYLADQQARRSPHPHAAAVLLDIEGNLTETSTANVLLIEAGKLICPPLENILHGVSLQRTLRLASALGMPVLHESISLQRAVSAEELLLCGSTGCLWPAASLNDRQFHAAATRSGFVALSRQWRDDIELDYIAQARELAETARGPS